MVSAAHPIPTRVVRGGRRRKAHRDPCSVLTLTCKRAASAYSGCAPLYSFTCWATVCCIIMICVCCAWASVRCCACSATTVAYSIGSSARSAVSSCCVYGLSIPGRCSPCCACCGAITCCRRVRSSWRSLSKAANRAVSSSRSRSAREASAFRFVRMLWLARRCVGGRGFSRRAFCARFCLYRRGILRGRFVFCTDLKGGLSLYALGRCDVLAFHMGFLPDKIVR
jgi:hypothetical protein